MEPDLTNITIKQWNNGEFNREGVFIEGTQLHWVADVKVNMEMDNIARVTIMLPCKIKLE